MFLGKRRAFRGPLEIGIALKSKHRNKQSQHFINIQTSPQIRRKSTLTAKNYSHKQEYTKAIHSTRQYAYGSPPDKKSTYSVLATPRVLSTSHWSDHCRN